MTPNRRIALNVIATYGRSLYAMACGLLTSRWALLALGQVDLGLYGVVGGLTIFVTFLNALMAGAVGRFYAFSVGVAQKNGNSEDSLDECRRWFNVALSIHFVLPIILLAAGYPCGIWAIENFLTIPAERISDVIWVWRFTCLSAGVGMMTVPFSAMYNAKQEIAELTIYGVITTTLNIIAVYYMVSHPGVWLKSYALCMCLTSILPLLIIVFRALQCYPECKIVPQFMVDWIRLRQLMVYAAATACSSISKILSIQGVAILVNKYLGAAKNATLTIGNSVTNHCMTLSSSFSGALRPAITNAIGAGKDEYARSLAYRACQLSALAFLIFMLPLLVEMDYVLRIWLKTPPDGLEQLSSLLLIGFVLDRMTDGHWMIILGYGKIISYQLMESLAVLSTFLLVILFFFVGMDIEAVGLGLILAKILRMIVNLYFGHKLGGVSTKTWIVRIFVPTMAVSLIVYLVGYFTSSMLPDGFCRLITVTGIMEFVFLVLGWFYILDNGSREFIVGKIQSGCRALNLVQRG